MPTIEDAILLATDKHRGVKDKGGAPYILHPLRLMCQFRTEAAQMAAVLHDVVEDSDVTLDDLRRLGYPAEVIEAVDHLTRRSGETYEQFIQRIKPHPLARRIKLADLLDNMDIRRAGGLDQSALERFQRYRAAWIELTGETT